MHRAAISFVAFLVLCDRLSNARANLVRRPHSSDVETLFVIGVISAHNLLTTTSLLLN